MACVEKENTGHCSHFQCPFSETMDLDCVDVKFLNGVGFCEIGLNCILECPYSYGPQMEKTAEAAFEIEYGTPKNSRVMDFKVNLIEAVKFLLKQKYFSEFEVIDRLNQHPDEINFYEWLFKHKLIGDEENQRIQAEIKAEYEDEE